MYIYNRLDEDGKVLTPEEILYRVCSSVCFIFLVTICALLKFQFQ